MSKFTDAIDARRRELGVTKQAMAEKLGLSWDGINSKLTGKTDFYITEVETIANWWGLSISELIGRG